MSDGPRGSPAPSLKLPTRQFLNALLGGNKKGGKNPIERIFSCADLRNLQENKNNHLFLN